MFSVSCDPGPRTRQSRQPCGAALPIQQQARQRKLGRAIASKDSDLRHRAIRELGWAAQSNPKAREVLTRRLLRPADLNMSDDFALVQALSRMKNQPAAEVIATICKAGWNKRPIEPALSVIGALGSKGKKAVPLLVAQLGKDDTAPEIQGRVMAVLANLGIERGKYGKLISSDIRARNERGSGAMGMMADIGAGEWVNNVVIAELAKLLGSPEEEDSAFAAIAIASRGKRGKVAKRQLQMALRTAQASESSSLRIIYGTCLAKIDPAKGESYMREVLDYLSREDAHTDEAALYSVGVLFDGEITKHVIQMLADKDPKVVKGAILTVMVIGICDDDARDPLLTIAKDSPHDHLRQEAGRALRFIGRVTDTPRLEAMLSVEKSEHARQAMREAIRIMRLEESK